MRFFLTTEDLAAYDRPNFILPNLILLQAVAPGRFGLGSRKGGGQLCQSNGSSF